MHSWYTLLKSVHSDVASAPVLLREHAAVLPLKNANVGETSVHIIKHAAAMLLNIANI